MLRFYLTTVLIIVVTTFFAGTTGKLVGRVKDEAGRGVSNANVLICKDSVMVTGNLTKEAGSYIVINIPPGDYEVLFQLQGFDLFVIYGVRINADQTTTQNATLRRSAYPPSEIIMKITEPESHKINLKNITPFGTTEMKPPGDFPTIIVDGNGHYAVKPLEPVKPALDKALSGSLKGKIKDQDGKAVANVNVLVYNKHQKAIKIAHTNEKGKYQINDLPHGEYQVRFTLQGYYNSRLEEILIKAKHKTKFNHILVRNSNFHITSPHLTPKAIDKEPKTELEILEKSPGDKLKWNVTGSEREIDLKKYKYWQ
jgi:5-hydroxyisourate hydrolase-like protein (transthyretin family)